MTFEEENFDGACKWPERMCRASHGASLSMHPGVVEFFAQCNAQWVDTAASLAGEHQTVTFSHFLPRRDVYQGYSNIARVRCITSHSKSLRVCITLHSKSSFSC